MGGGRGAKVSIVKVGIGKLGEERAGPPLTVADHQNVLRFVQCRRAAPELVRHGGNARAERLLPLPSAPAPPSALRRCAVHAVHVRVRRAQLRGTEALQRLGHGAAITLV